MSFSFIWSPQTHKVFGGYYLNHDNLMIASREDRKKLIFYFIGSQTPEKLNPSDRETFLEEKKKLDNNSATIGALCAVAFGLSPGVKSKYNPRYLLNFAYKAIGVTFFFYLGMQVYYGINEPKFVSRNPIIKELSEKYSFTVFDFAQAKKESHLKELRNELTSESSNLLYQ